MDTKKKKDSNSVEGAAEMVKSMGVNIEKMIANAQNTLKQIPKLQVKLKKERIIKGRAASISYTDTGAIIIEFKDDKNKEISLQHYESL